MSSPVLVLTVLAVTGVVQILIPRLTHAEVDRTGDLLIEASGIAEQVVEKMREVEKEDGDDVSRAYDDMIKSWASWRRVQKRSG